MFVREGVVEAGGRKKHAPSFRNGDEQARAVGPDSIGEGSKSAFENSRPIKHPRTSHTFRLQLHSSIDHSWLRSRKDDPIPSCLQLIATRNAWPCRVYLARFLERLRCLYNWHCVKLQESTMKLSQNQATRIRAS